MAVPRASVPDATSRRFVASAAVIVGLCLVVASFAVQLNGRFYARQQPFYDSMSYHAQVHRVMTRAASDGVVPALAQACRSSTVCLPPVLAAVVGPFLQPSRLIGIGIQCLELVFFAATLAFYLARIRGLPPATTALAVVPFLLWGCLYEPSGGLSDFRMDLSLALLFATTVLWYLIAMETRSWSHFIVLGLSAAAACLFRATAPVYLMLAILPLAIADLVPQPTRLARLLGLAVAAVIAAAGCGWFFVLNYEALHYYYVVWNTDANARLPLVKALRHVAFAVGHVGPPAAVLALAFPLARAVDGWRDGRRPGPARFDWRMLWIGVAPVVLLVSRGAGLNPYVSMPAAFGLTMLLMLPVAGAPARDLSRPAFMGLALLAAGGAAVTASHGWQRHFGGAIDSMAAHREAIRQIVGDARAAGRDAASYATTHCFFLNQDSLESVVLFDTPGVEIVEALPRVEGVLLRTHSGFAVAAEADWAAVPGDSTQSKLDHILAVADREIDYLAIPDEDTARFLEERMQYYIINRHATVLRRRLLESGRWEPVGGDIRNGEHEVVRIYRNAVRRGRADQASGAASRPGSKRSGRKASGSLQSCGRRPTSSTVGGQRGGRPATTPGPRGRRVLVVVGHDVEQDVPNDPVHVGGSGLCG